MTLKGKVRYQFLPLVFIPLGLLLYADALRAPFVYDDRGYIIQNEAIRSLSNFLDFSGTRYVGFLSFALNYSIGGLTPFDFHLVNIVIHVINSILVFFLIASTLDTPLFRSFSAEKEPVVAIAFVSSAIFLSHPVETQAVTYVTQRFASLATMFYLLAVVLYARARTASLMPGIPRSRIYSRYSLSILSTVLAMKTKEISFTIPFAIFIYDLVFFPDRKAREGVLMRIPYYLTLLIIPLSVISPEVTGASEGTVTESLRRLQLQEAAALPRGVYVLTQFSVIVTYMRLLFFPSGLTIDYKYAIAQSFFEPRTLASFILIATLFSLAVHALVTSKRRGDLYGVLFSFGVFWFFNALLVESFLVPIQDVIFEQRVYLPSAGLIPAFTAVLFAWFRALRDRYGLRVSHAVAAGVILVIVTPPLFAGTINRNRVWTDEMLLLTDAIEKSPGKSRLYYARAGLLIDRRDFPGALRDAAESIRLNPNSADAFNIRGIALSGMGRFKESIKDFDRAILLKPGDGAFYYNRASSLDAAGDADGAIAGYTKAIESRPDFGDAYNNRGVALARKGDLRKAFEDVKKACSLGHRTACENLVLLSTGSAVR